MRRRLRKPLAAALAGVAAVAFVATPILHAEAHVREAAQAERDRSAAFERIFAIVFSGALDGRRAELEHALTAVLDRGGAGAPHLHGPGEAPRQHGDGGKGGGVPHHSHGPGPHGAGSLHHLAAALHVAQVPAAAAQPAVFAAASVHRPAARFLSRISYLVEQSQGPPRA